MITYHLKKKKKKRRSLLVRTSEKTLKSFKKDMIEKMDNVFLATSESNADDFKEYKDTSLDWSWDNIMDGS